MFVVAIPRMARLDRSRTPRAACAASGHTTPSGSAITPGAFLELRPGQPAKDAHYAGATIARFVQGTGLTCDAAPAGYVQKGLAGDAQHVPDGLYPYFAAAYVTGSWRAAGGRHATTR